MRSIARSNPPELVQPQLVGVPRIANVGLVGERCAPNVAACDVGSGIGLFSLGCAVGMRVMLIDDFGDAVNERFDDSVRYLNRSRGVEVVSRDVIEGGRDLEAGSLDAVTAFESLEQWHHSPKRLLPSILDALRPGGSLTNFRTRPSTRG